MKQLKSKRFEILIPRPLHAKAQERADELEISLAAYIKDLMKADLEWVKNA